MEQNKYIQYEDLIKRNEKLNQLNKQGFIIIPKRNLKVLGWVFIGFGVLTVPIPLTTFILIGFGLSLLGLSRYDLLEKLRRKIKLIKYRLRSKG